MKQTQLIITILLALMMSPAGVSASSIRAVTVDEMINRAGVVFNGTVIGKSTHRDSSNGNIYTDVTFSVTTVIFGDLAESEIVLTYMGGEYAGLRLEIAGTSVPQLGEEVVLFAENPSKRLVNPAYGWSQGYFRVLSDSTDGQKYVFTESGKPVSNIASGHGATGSAMSSDGVAVGIEFGDDADAHGKMSLDAFVATLRSIEEQTPRE